MFFKDSSNIKRKPYVICLIPGHKSFKDLIQIVQLFPNSDNPSKVFYNKFKNKYDRINLSENENLKISNNVSIELFYKHIIFTKTLQLNPSNFELEWNNIWKYKALNFSIVTNNNKKLMLFIIFGSCYS